MVVPGSEYLTNFLHALSESLLIPVIFGLIILLIYALMELGVFVGERKKRTKKKQVNLEEILCNIGHVVPWKIRNFQQVVENSSLLERQKNKVISLLKKTELSKDAKEIVVRDMLDREESTYRSMINKTDILAKVGPMLGLMGTLIPLGPGLAALGQGDFQGLAQAVIVAFDTTVIGMVIGGVGACISKVRSSWYIHDLNSLEVVLDLIIGGEGHGSQENEAATAGRRGS